MAKSHKSRNWHKNNRRSRNMRGGDFKDDGDLKKLNDLLTQIKDKLPDKSEYKNATFVSVKRDPPVDNEIVINNAAEYDTAFDALTELSKEGEETKERPRRRRRPRGGLRPSRRASPAC